MVSGLRHLQGSADVSNGLALGDQLLSGFQLADDLLGSMAGSFHGGVPGPAWPNEVSHPPWTDFRGPRQLEAGGVQDQTISVMPDERPAMSPVEISPLELMLPRGPSVSTVEEDRSDVK